MYEKYRRVTDENTFRPLARQLRVCVETFRKGHEQGILKSASIKKNYAYARDRINSSSQIGPIL